MITIVDYGVGNIQAFVNIYKELGIPYSLAKTKDELNNASKIILPGVGHFDFAMKKLTDSGMIEMLHHKVLQEKIPVLGICVGMQIMAQSSEEGKLDGLNWITGKVKKIDTSALLQNTLLPHMGWNTIEIKQYSTLFHDFQSDPDFYFLHSYVMECQDKNNILATTEYGEEITVIVQKDNIYGIQFHPEKSHQIGVQFLNNFVNL